MEWGNGVFNLIGWGLSNSEGDNLITEDGQFYFYENEESIITQSPTYELNGWGSVYAVSWSGQTKLSR
jgi:hypothetical protein